MFDILSKIALRNKGTGSLGGLFFKGGTVSATNLVFSASFITDAFEGLNCYLPVELFMEGLKSIKADTVVEQKKGVVSFTTGKATLNVPMMNEGDFPQFTSELDEENAVEFSADGFLSALGKLSKATSADQIFLVGNYAYKTDSYVLVRSELKQNFPEEIILSSDFFNLFAKLTEEPTKLLLSPNAFRVVFKNGYVETGRLKQKLPLNFVEFFKKFNDYPFESLDPEVSEGLTKALSLAKLGDEIIFKKKGIALTRKDSEIFQLDYSLSTPKRFDIKNLNAILKNGNVFDFNLKDFIAFKGEFVEGAAGFKQVKG